MAFFVFSYRHPHFFADRIQPWLHRITALIHQVPVPSLSMPASLALPKSLRRAGEGKLLRWAHEDLELDAEDDVMVNGGDDFDELRMQPWEPLQLLHIA